MPSLAPHEDLVHAPEPDRVWRESYHFGFGDPAGGRFGYATFGKRPLTGRSGFLIALWDAEHGVLVGQEVDRFEVHDDTHAVAGLTCSCVEPFGEWRVAFDGELVRVPALAGRRYEEARAVAPEDRVAVPVSFEFDWTATAPAHAYTWTPAWRALFHGRHEQPGRCDGTLAVDGRRVAIDGWHGIRDHAWGARDWFGAHGWRWVSATFDEPPHLSLLYARLDDGSSVVDGAIYDAAGASPIVHYEERVSERAAPGKPEPTAVEFAVRDAGGRTVEVRGTVEAALPIRFRPPDGGLVSWNDRCIMRFSAAHAEGIGEMEFMALADDGGDGQGGQG